ncbi:HsdM family class I SAM-dependent methyltransferase [Novosphingobium cyanobacteriorum]|uniref:site-specific DNA-methyltransferase (adenine-specific) n=1 Tax=Novosphingobium cyanobacteriorum TaxID=3024215 RepID=A0ABT6CPD0_9SPHN|nr:N-6 DNA methylase [Novosphingobium cyanobacteriorum]MDF8335771.1 N-6 DNA methylase [Novosphingobium cyanobacteriorum]
MSTVDLANAVEPFGGDATALRRFDEDGPHLLPYATLVNARRAASSVLGVIMAVYEWQGAPLLFLVDGEALDNDEQLHRIRRLLAMRGDAPYLGVIAPGRLDVYRIALDRKTLRQSRVSLPSGEGIERNTFAHLANSRPRAAINQSGWISNVVLNLLTASITKLIATGAVTDEDAISLVGRALFARFLADRELLPAAMAGPDVAAALFDDTASASRTCQWLDDTFNGDLLPLSEGLFDRLPLSAYRALGDVLRRAPDSQLFLGWQERWDNLDFAHIPVGVLSQAYELYLRRHAPAKQKREGGYYTPRPIADLVVRACFGGLARQGGCADAKILDPAAGAGVFLLTAFRELVAERWAADGHRPQTPALRAILYDQIVGFDINEAALRFAALGLYLLSIELDPQPMPVDKLRFDDLRGKVLHRLTSEDATLAGGRLGSLGPLVLEEHRGRYDVVIGNPPWASGTKLPDWSLVCEEVARIAQARKIGNPTPPLPNEVLDLPFIWRAMDWAKPGGQIGFALHARLLFQQGDGMPDARQAIFEALDVTSIVNGVELRQTRVWPEISAPFCLMIATNRPAAAGSGFRLISPRLEESLNAAGTMRVDPQSAEIIRTHQMAETPDILKILFRGTRADLGIVERVRSKGYPTLETFWRSAIGVSKRGRLLGGGSGYQTLKDSSRPRLRGDGLPGADASYLHGLPDIDVAAFDDVLVKSDRLRTFRFHRIHDPRDPALFVGPLAIVHQSPPVEHGRIRVAVSDKALAYNESFYGFSPGTYPDGDIFARYLALVVGSRFALWWALVTSGKFGFEREVVEKSTIDRMPMPDFGQFGEAERAEITAIFSRLQTGEITWESVDRWVADLYGLGERDLEVIADTLTFNLPFANAKHAAQEFPDRANVTAFCEKLLGELAPWGARYDSSFEADLVHYSASSPWCCIALRHRGGAGPNVIEQDLAGLLQAADATGAGELIAEAQGMLLIGRLAQQRYWSATQARLLAQRIIWSHLPFLQARTKG